MQEPTPEERKIQIIAAAVGMTVALAFAVYIGMREGVDIGIAAFVLSWTFVALFVLLVRTVFRRATASREAAAPAPPPQAAGGQPARRQNRRRRRKR